MKEKERKRVLDNFYTKEMKSGKAKRAYVIDKIALGIVLFLLLFFLIDKVLKHILISFIISTGITIYLGIIFSRKDKKIRDEKIKKIKTDYKQKLIEENILVEEDDIEDYIIKRYKERKKEFKENVDIYAKGKASKLYILAGVFYVASYFVDYSIYYKIMGILSFIIASFIASRKLTEYVRQKDNNGLLDRDIDV